VSAPVTGGRSLRLFGALALLSFAAIDFGADASTGWWLGRDAIGRTLAAHAVQWREDPLTLLFFFFPFALVAVACAWLADKAGRGPAMILFAVSAAALAALWCWGYGAGQNAMAAGHFTAGALSIGFLPFFAMPVVALAAIAAVTLAARTRRS
jgi:hypothetical protein